jgi:hypothetical protein
MVEVGNGEMTAIMLAVGNALGDALVRAGPRCSAPGTRPRRSAGGARRGSACDRGAPGAGCRRGARRRVHRGAWGRAHDPGAGGLEDGVERDSEV